MFTHLSLTLQYEQIPDGEDRVPAGKTCEEADEPGRDEHEGTHP